MGATATSVPTKRHPLAPAAIDYMLALGALLMLAAVVAAILRGHAEWGALPFQIWFHLATIGIALVLTPVMLLRSRGDRLHRRLGYLWLAAMVVTAASTFFIRTIYPGSFSPIHLLSLYTFFVAWRIVATARSHQAIAHRRQVRGIVIGALLIAGFFTFPFNRLLGHWLLG